MARGKKAKSATGSITPLPEDSTKAVAAQGGAVLNVLTLIPDTTNATQGNSGGSGEKGSQHEADSDPKASKNPFVREIEKYGMPLILYFIHCCSDI